MRAALLNNEPGDLEIEDVTLDDCGPREIRMKVSSAGLCHSDLHFMDGSWPMMGASMVMGHESAGVVETVGRDVTYVQPGDHVITCLSVFCGTCRYCTNGQLSICSNRSQLTARDNPSHTRANGSAAVPMAGLGSFAEEMLVHENAIVKIRPDMPLDTASLIGCGVTTGLGAVFRTAKVEPGSDVVVLGAGGIGTAAIQGARIAGAGRIIAVDLNDAKLQHAEAMGATHTVNGTDGNAIEAVKEITGGGVDYSFEAIGLKVTAEQAWHMLAPGGTATIIGMVPFGQTIEIPAHETFLMEKKLQGSMMGSNQFRTDMPRFIELYMDGRLKLDEMVSAHITLDEVNDGYAMMKQGESVRTVIDF